MWLLVTFIVIWALSPGPVAIMTLHESRKNGMGSGFAISLGATVTSILMVIGGVLLYTAGFSNILASDNMILVERLGAIGIISMGLYAAYKSLRAQGMETTPADLNPGTKGSFVQGMLVMATYIPQALIFHNLIVPQSVEPSSVIAAIIGLGILKVVLIFGWLSGIAYMATRTQGMMQKNRFSKLLEISPACLMVVLGVNTLF